MRKKLFLVLKILVAIPVILIIVIFVLVGGLFIYQNSFCRDRADRKVANTIPKYPNAQFWTVTDGITPCLLGGGTPGADIYFYSNDKPQNVISFYKQELPKSHWNFKGEGHFFGGISPDMYASFRKEVQGKQAKFDFHSRSDGPDSKEGDWNYSISIRGLYEK